MRSGSCVVAGKGITIKASAALWARCLSPLSLFIPMDIREADTSHLEAILPIQRQVHELHVQREPDRYKPISDVDLRAYLQSHIVNHKSCVFVAVNMDEVVGYLVLETRQSADTPFTFARRYGLVDQMGVRSDMQRRGIGAQLLEAAKKSCATANLESLQLDVRQPNEEARAFYEAFGFSVANLHMVMPVAG